MIGGGDRRRKKESGVRNQESELAASGYSAESARSRSRLVKTSPKLQHDSGRLSLAITRERNGAFDGKNAVKSKAAWRRSSMGWSVLDPEVAGGWGERTVADTSVHPPVVALLNYQFDGWLGDELLTSFPCYVVTRLLGDKLSEARLNGFQLADVQVSVSEQFEEIYPDRHLPEFYWLQVDGSAGVDDFGLSRRHQLVVSDRALAVLQTGQLRHCGVKAWRQKAS